MSDKDPPTLGDLSAELAKLAKLMNDTNADLRWCLDTIKKDYGITDKELKNDA